MNGLRRLRAASRKDRDREAITNLLGLREIRMVRKVFTSASVTFFDCATLPGIVFARSGPVSKRYHQAAQQADRILLNKLSLRWLAFKFVIDAIKLGSEPAISASPASVAEARVGPTK